MSEDITTVDREKLKKGIVISLHLFIGHCLEKIDKTLAMNYFHWAMRPYNKYPLYGEWFRLWNNTKIKELLETGNICLTYASDETVERLNRNRNLTFKEYHELRMSGKEL